MFTVWLAHEHIYLAMVFEILNIMNWRALAILTGAGR